MPNSALRPCVSGPKGVSSVAETTHGVDRAHLAAIGDAVCFSFHPRKVITTGDGGMITTANAQHGERYRLWRQHGMSVSNVVRHGSHKVVFETYPVTGFNYRMTDIQAAMGRPQLRRLGALIKRRREIAASYRESPLRTSMACCFRTSPAGLDRIGRAFALVFPRAQTSAKSCKAW